VHYTSVKNVLIPSWRFKTLAVMKRHKNHLSFYPCSRAGSTLTSLRAGYKINDLFPGSLFNSKPQTIT